MCFRSCVPIHSFIWNGRSINNREEICALKKGPDFSTRPAPRPIAALSFAASRLQHHYLLFGLSPELQKMWIVGRVEKCIRYWILIALSMYLFEVPTILANSFSAVCTNFDESFDVSYKS